ncbi:MAG: C39 family peptidase [Ruminococcus sp.]|nr:C39 family peptidase [Ruminococcus sp.]
MKKMRITAGIVCALMTVSMNVSAEELSESYDNEQIQNYEIEQVQTYEAQNEAEAVAAPAAPSGELKAVLYGDQIRLSWNKSADAALYNVYLINGSQRTLIGTVDLPTFGYKAGSSSAYTFEVRSAVKSGNETIESQQGITASFATSPDKVTDLQNSGKSENVKLSWSAVKCSRYYVYRSSGGDYSLVGTVGTNSFEETLTSGGEYKYIVKAVYTDQNGTDHLSEASNEVTKVYLAKPVMEDSISGINAVRVRWKAVENATSYRVFIYKNGAWQPYKITKNLYYTFTGLDSKTTYLFHVQPCMQSGGKTVVAAGSSVKVVTDSRLRSRSAFVIYSSASTSSQVLYRGTKGFVVQQKGIPDVAGWYKVYVPGTAKAKVGYVRAGQMAGYQNLGTRAINQNGWEGGAPMVMGCESAALATVLQNHLGISCSKNDIANNYTYWVSHGKGDPNYAFWGSPYIYTGNDGIYAPAIGQAANWYLKNKGVRNDYQIDIHTDFNSTVNWNNLDIGNAKHSAGLDLAGLKRELNKGHTLVVWFTTYNAAPRSGGWYTITRGGKFSNAGSGKYSFNWVAPQHCAVITGFDDVTQKIRIADVINGNTVFYPYTTFMRGYNALGRQTVVVDKL